MPGQTPEAAFGAFYEPIVEAIRCLNMHAPLNKVRNADGTYFFGSPAAGGVEFQTDAATPFTIEFAWHLDLITMDGGQYRMTTRKYLHELRDNMGRRIGGWHWHPKSKQSHITYPHFHLPADANFSSKHFPSGRIAIEEIVEFAIDELGAKPTNNAWRKKLDGSLGLHRQHRRADLPRN